MTAPSPLVGGFAPSTEADWRALVARGGRTPDDLAGRSDDGIAVGPIYRRAADGQAIPARPFGERWRIVQRLSARDAAAAARQAAEAIAGGANGIAAVFQSSPHPLAGGLSPAAAADLARALSDALPDGALLALDAGEATPTVARPLVEVAVRRRWRLALAFDPTATLAARGRAGRTSDDSAADVVALARSFDEHAIHGTVALADGRLWHAGGASEAQELAAVLATVVWLARRFEEGGHSLDEAAARIAVALAADTDQFLTIAKFRAARLLAARVFEAAGIAAPPLPVHGETAWRMMSARDPHTNILRTTAAAFSAAVGGADSITVFPFDAVSGEADPLADRLARNTQAILADEANIFRVADPGAGSGAIEALTAALAAAAWKQFQAIEAAGGIRAALGSGTLQRDIAAVRDARLARVGERSALMVGVNAYLDERESGVTAPAPRRSEPAADAVAEDIEPLVFTRLSAAFEIAQEPA
jgi:methylmalonyl-CoA mutase